MVTAIKRGEETLYRCDAKRCGLLYRERALAEQCQQWCETHDS